MSVVIDCTSATRLIAEGAICFDTDTRTAVCDGLPALLPSGCAKPSRPILVCGSSPTATRALAEHLQGSGLPAWQVVDDADAVHRTGECCRHAIVAQEETSAAS